MAQNYTRQSAIADGDTITASLFNNEYNQLVNTFAYSASSADSTGHRHDGTTAQGGNIFKIGDLDFLNKVEVDGTNNRIGFYVEVSSAAVEQIRVQDGAIVPVTDSDIDLGTSSLEFKDLFLDGTAHIDTLDVDANATVAGTLGVTGNTTVGGTLGVTGVLTGTSLDISGDVDIDGTTNLDVVDIDGAVDMASTLTVTGVLTGTSLDISGDVDVDGTTNLDIVDIDGAVNMATTLIVTGNVDFDGDLDVDGTTNLDAVDIDGAVNMATTLAVEGNVDFNGDLDVDGTIEFDAISGTGAVTVTNILDEDDMSSDSATALATQQSIKAYVDAQQDTVDTFGEVLALSNTTAGTDISVSTDDKVQFRDSAIYINSSVDGQLDIVADTEIQIAATTVDINGAVALNGAVTGATNITLSGELDAATGDFSGAVDIDGALDVAGTTNLDVVDIDGAVNMATTALVTGVLTTTATQVATGGITSGSNIVSDTDSTDDLGTTSVRWANLFVDSITATDQITATGFTGTLDGILGSGAAAAATVTTLDTSGAVNLNLITDSSSSTSGALIVDGGVGIAKKLYVGTDLDVDGTTNLDVVDIDGAVDMASTLQVDGISTFTGQITANGGMEFVDGKKLTFGTGDDLEIYHDGSNSYINDVGTGNLLIRGANVVITTGAGTKYLEGGANVLTLFHTGNERLRTTSAGVDVTGTVTATGTSVFASLDISGDIDVDGTTNLDVVDIDGAVDMASTLAVAGTLGVTGATTLSAATAINANVASPLTINATLDSIAYSEIFNISTGASAAAYFGIVTQNLANSGTIRSGMFFDSSNHLNFINGEAGGAGIVLDDNNAVTMSGSLGIGGANPSAVPLYVEKDIARMRLAAVGTGGANQATVQFYNEGTFKGQIGYREASDDFEIWSQNGSAVTMTMDVSNNVAIPNGSLSVAGKYNITRGDITIASGAITPTTSYVRLDTQSAASSDDLDTINGGAVGDIVILETRISSRDVVVKDGTGNLGLAGGADFTLVNKSSTITLIYDGTAWLEISRSSN